MDVKGMPPAPRVAAAAAAVSSKPQHPATSQFSSSRSSSSASSSASMPSNPLLLSSSSGMGASASSTTSMSSLASRMLKLGVASNQRAQQQQQQQKQKEKEAIKSGGESRSFPPNGTVAVSKAAAPKAGVAAVTSTSQTVAKPQKAADISSVATTAASHIDLTEQETRPNKAVRVSPRPNGGAPPSAIAKKKPGPAAVESPILVPAPSPKLPTVAPSKPAVAAAEHHHESDDYDPNREDRAATIAEAQLEKERVERKRIEAEQKKEKTKKEKEEQKKASKAAVAAEKKKGKKAAAAGGKRKRRKPSGGRSRVIDDEASETDGEADSEDQELVEEEGFKQHVYKRSRAEAAAQEAEEEAALENETADPDEQREIGKVKIQEQMRAVELAKHTYEEELSTLELLKATESAESTDAMTTDELTLLVRDIKSQSKVKFDKVKSGLVVPMELDTRTSEEIEMWNLTWAAIEECCDATEATVPLDVVGGAKTSFRRSEVEDLNLVIHTLKYVWRGFSEEEGKDAPIVMISAETDNYQRQRWKLSCLYISDGSCKPFTRYVVPSESWMSKVIRMKDVTSPITSIRKEAAVRELPEHLQACTDLAFLWLLYRTIGKEEEI